MNPKTSKSAESRLADLTYVPAVEYCDMVELAFQG